MASLLTPAFVAQAGLPTDPDAQAAEIARGGTSARPSCMSRWSARAICRRDRASPASWTRRVLPAGGWRCARPRPSRRSGPSWRTPSGPRGQRTSWSSPVTWWRPRSRRPTSTCWRSSASASGRRRPIVIEDSRNGLLAAHAAGLATVVTVNGYTRDEDFSEAALVVSSLGDPEAEPIEVLADRAGVGAGDYVTLSDLQACLP